MTRLLILFVMLFTSLTIMGQNPTEFKLCNDGKTYPYYYPELKYEGDLLAISQHYYSSYDIEKFKNTVNNSGILTIQFHVNCKGETGNFTVKMVDFNYVEIDIDTGIVNKIVSITKELNRWIPAIDDDGMIVNSHKFISFKLVNSRITEIYPK